MTKDEALKLLEEATRSCNNIDEQRALDALMRIALAQPEQPAAQAEPSQVQQLVNEQAEDEALWCDARTIAESMLQSALRKLHAAIEAKEAIAQPVQLKQAEAARATARIAIGHLNKVLNECRTAPEQQGADTAARDWLASIGAT